MEPGAGHGQANRRKDRQAHAGEPKEGEAQCHHNQPLSASRVEPHSLSSLPPHPTAQGFTCSDLWRSKLGAGVLGLMLNHDNMLLQRTTAEWGRGAYAL